MDHTDSGNGSNGSRLTPLAVVGRMISETRRAADLFPLLHEDAIAAVGGRCSILVQIDPRTALLHPTSAVGLDRVPPDPWILSEAEARAADDAFRNEAPLVLDNLEAKLPALAERLGATSVLLVPLFQVRERLALLVVGLDQPLVTVPNRLFTVAHAFVLAIERARLQREAELQQEVRRLLDGFSRVATSSLNLSTGLDVFCRDANVLFNAERTSIWLHDRPARELVLSASSDAAYLAHGARVSIESDRSPAAAALRKPRAEIQEPHADRPSAADARSVITVPLKGRRRALGTLVFECVQMEPGTELDLLDNADLVGRELSGAIENVQLLEEVLRSRREMEKTVNSLPDLVAVFDAALHLMNVNQAFADRVGLARPQMTGRLLTDFLCRDAAEWVTRIEVGARTAHAAESLSCELDDGMLGGRFSMTTSTLVSPEGDALGGILVARDITPQTRLEEERQALNDRLTQSEKLAALGQFVAGIAHELNNPLQAVLGHVELIRGRTGLPREMQRELQIVYREADRAAKIVRNLLVFAGKRRLSRRVVNLNTLAGKALANRASACRSAGIEIVRQFDDKVPKLLADPVMLQQAILNIVINAEQAVGKKRGGRIEATTRWRPARNQAVIEIRDTGPGIAADVLAHMFEPFYTTKEVGQGTGLGLAITYGIVQEHGGQVHAANHPDGGAILTIELLAGKE